MRLVIALVAALAAGPALAADFTTVQPGPRTTNGYALAPTYSDWINLKIDAVDSKTAGECKVRGTVTAVYSGLHYRRGETAVVGVPCAGSQLVPLQLSAFGSFWVDRDWLPSVKLATIQLDDDGRVVSFAADAGLTRIY